MSVPSDPRSIHAYRIGKTFRMVIDGQEFPWDITSLSTDISPDGWPAVTITIPARAVEITNMLDERRDG